MHGAGCASVRVRVGRGENRRTRRADPCKALHEGPLDRQCIPTLYSVSVYTHALVEE